MKTNLTYDVIFNDDNASNSKGWHETFEHTYDVVFQDDNSSNSKGWHETFEYCKNYIESNNGTNNSYFADYKGGTVSIYCNETGNEVYTCQCK